MIYVAGPASGGTSCVAGILHHLGVDMGRWLDRPGIRGYVTYEDTHCPRFVLTPDGPGPRLLRQRIRIRDYLEFRREQNPSGRIGFKASPLWWLLDPEPQTLPLAVVRVTRPIEESIASDLRIQAKIHAERPDLSPRPLSAVERVDSASVIAACWQAAAELAELFPSVTVAFDEVRERPEEAVGWLAQHLEIEATDEQIDAAVGSVKPPVGPRLCT